MGLSFALSPANATDTMWGDSVVVMNLALNQAGGRDFIGLGRTSSSGCFSDCDPLRPSGGVLGTEKFFFELFLFIPFLFLFSLL